MAELESGLIYIADDEPNIRRLVSVALNECGYETQEFSGGDDLLKAIQRRNPDLIILDWVMPAPDGLSVCGRLKLDNLTKTIPIIMLSSRNEEVDVVLGLEMGADDYVTKPFSVKELCARVKALLRRNEYMNITPASNEVIVCGELTVNLARRTVIKHNKTIDLTMKEFDLLTSLMLAKGRVFNRDQLMEKVWDVEFSGDARTVDVHIRYLRQKIEEDAENPKYVLTVRGVGYRFASEEEINPEDQQETA
ncbi:MAG: response regulator transcription factor [Clostridia bacterium]|nr:response regulator transcription factor [Clostridia bacterium]